MYVCIWAVGEKDKLSPTVRKILTETHTVQFDNKYAAAKKMAELASVSPEELIITSNTTLSLLK